ncbi:MAG: hypothetical protein ABIC68_02895 [Candidatus Omnitrophota bacterium]
MIKRITLMLIMLFLVGAGLSDAAIPRLINYQGKVTDSNNVPLTGSYAVAFRIYDAESGGNMLWEEAHTGVVIDNGLFNILLGSVTNLDIPFDKPYFLEIKVDNEVMSPRQQITASAYAMRAQNTDSLPRGVIVAWSGTVADIPSGWILCNGANGTPDLRDRFIIGARQDEGGIAETQVTGSLTKSGGSAVKNLSHSHTFSGYTNGVTTGSWGGQVGWHHEGGTANYQHNYSGTTSSSGSMVQDILNPYYALVFIMKS